MVGLGEVVVSQREGSVKAVRAAAIVAFLESVGLLPWCVSLWLLGQQRFFRKHFPKCSDSRKPGSGHDGRVQCDSSIVDCKFRKRLEFTRSNRIVGGCK